MAAARPNLARRPFVDARPANVAAAVLIVAAVVLTLVAARTVVSYLEDSRTSREQVAALKGEIARLDEARRESERKLARFDLAGMQAGVEEANALAKLRSFSWSRFLTRLEKTLPNDVRVVSLSLTKEGESKTASERRPAPGPEAFPLSLSLVSRDPDGLPKVIRAFYDSPWFDAPVPVSESGGESGRSAEGRSMTINVLYTDREARP